MPTQQGKIEIAASATAVFSLITEPAWLAMWVGGMVSTERITPGPVAVGTRSRDVISSFGRTVEIDVEVIGLADQQLLELRVDSGAFSGTVSYRLARRDALTVLTVTSDTEFKGIYRLSAPLIAPRLQTKLDEDLAALKRLAESHVLDDKP